MVRNTSPLSREVLTRVRLVYDGEYEKLYLNGSLVDKLKIRLYTVPKQFYIGVQVGMKPSQEGFPGVIDEVRIYNRALSEEEIKALASGLDVKDGLVAYFGFDNVGEGDSIVASDVGGYEARVHGNPAIVSTGTQGQQTVSPTSTTAATRAITAGQTVTVTSTVTRTVWATKTATTTLYREPAAAAAAGFSYRGYRRVVGLH